MWFFSSLYKSLYNLPWLRQQKGDHGKAWGYFFLLMFLVVGLTLIPLFVGLPKGVSTIQSKFASDVPSFAADLKGGELVVTELVQPYVVKENEMVLVIDTVTTSPMQLSDYLTTNDTSGILITKDRLEIYNANNQQSRAQLWSGMPDYSITKDQALTALNKFLRWPILILICLGLFILYFIGLSIGRLAFILFWGFVVWLVAIMAKKNWSYREIFNVSLYATTLPLLFTLILSTSGASIRFLSTLLFVGLMVAVIFVKEEKLPEKTIEG
ncbi:MAG: hypothetical protein US58_C0007G0007 [Candidatus Magasanikbacteria bacterium GW2011_GWA2_37_8]|uniref:DUF1189 domain-containing protein n=1 Tax=Candidatus Magasanikbacteria bacterium GW2011_GWA2_37_8 TaxID=1619036 RepID=A0A0G0KK67_9BACT|nr:MAG: hypothetical protein US58_C0007G0007 [Candidatus Magasanikbacteria bacterium GW2011_GWA2_37_8]